MCSPINFKAVKIDHFFKKIKVMDKCNAGERNVRLVVVHFHITFLLTKIYKCTCTIGPSTNRGLLGYGNLPDPIMSSHSIIRDIGFRYAFIFICHIFREAYYPGYWFYPFLYAISFAKPIPLLIGLLHMLSTILILFSSLHGRLTLYGYAILSFLISWIVFILIIFE